MSSSAQSTKTYMLMSTESGNAISEAFSREECERQYAEMVAAEPPEGDPYAAWIEFDDDGMALAVYAGESWKDRL